MKKLAIFFTILILAGFSFAQTPQRFNYQGVARLANGNVIPEQEISLRVSILHDSPSGTVQYSEQHFLTTNQLGLFTAAIGNGSVLGGNFANISWGDGDKYLKVEIDPTGGSSFTLAGTFQLLSVPYALQSGNTERLLGRPLSPTPPTDEQALVWDAGAGEWTPADAVQQIVYTAGAGININASNVISNTAPDQVVVIAGTGATTVSGAYPNFTINTPVPADNSPTNELQTLSLNGSNLTLSNGGGTVTLPPEVDGSVTNEIQALSLNGNTLSLSNGGGSVTLNNGINYTAGSGIDISGNVISNTGDPDANPANELQTLTLNGNTLTLSNGGGSVTLNNGINYNEGTGIDITGNVISNTGDLSNTNELQTISLAGNTLILSNGGGTVDLPQPQEYTAGPGILINGDGQISNTGDLDPLDDITNGTSAGGDLSGTYPAPTVVGIQGREVSADEPALGQTLVWNGFTWAPATPSQSSSGWQLTGNAGTDSLNNFIGTTDDRPILFRVFNTRVGKLSRDDGNIFFGVQAGQNNTIGTENTAYGFQSLFANTEGGSNTAIGVQALYANTIGIANTAVGQAALGNNTEGEFNAAFGYGVLVSNSTGSLNTGIGVQALFDNTIGESNTATGGLAMTSNTEGSANTANGVSALNANTIGNANTALGCQSLNFNTEGEGNVAVGYQTLFSNDLGTVNTAVGTSALALNEGGDNNTAIGFQALVNSVSGNNNTAVGNNAMFNNTTGSNNTIIGGNANVSVGTLSNATALGNAATVNANNKIRFGNSSVTVVEGQVAYSFPSDGRFKFNVSEDVAGLDFIKRLRPVNYQFDTRKFEEFLTANMTEEARSQHLEGVDFTTSSSVTHTGFIAQEVEQAAREAGYNFDGVHTPASDADNYSIAYSQFVVPLVKAIQEQQTMIEQLQKENAELRAKMEEILKLVKE